MEYLMFVNIYGVLIFDVYIAYSNYSYGHIKQKTRGFLFFSTVYYCLFFYFLYKEAINIQLTTE